MYKSIIRPMLFCFSPEAIHHFVVFCLKFGFKIPLVKFLVSKQCKVENSKLERNVLGLKFKNPIGFAAGFDKNAEVFEELASFGFSHIEIGTVTPKAQSGNPKPRCFRLKQDNAIINRMGFNNHGVDYAVEKLKKRKSNIIIGGNIGKNTITPNEDAVNDYVYNLQKIHSYVDYFVVNVSCPNIANLGKLQNKESLMALLSKLKEVNLSFDKPKPMLLKLSPDLSQEHLDETLEVVLELGIDGIIATNTTTTRDNLTTDADKIAAIANGGLSGKPLFEKSLETVKYIASKTQKKIVIIAVGGIFDYEDAKKMLDAGADLIQVYTGFIYEGPFMVKKILKKIVNS